MTQTNGKISNVPQRHAPLPPNYEQACLGYLKTLYANAPAVQQKNPHALMEVQSWARLVLDPALNRLSRGHDTDGDS